MVRLDVNVLDLIDAGRNEDLYYYRALNDTDIANCKAKHPLSSIKKDKGKTCANKISRHIRDGSKYEYSECWISACKNLEICAKEFSIPQVGKYNTATNRKRLL